ncbi:IcmT/TraK family protein [Salmonella enterica]|nr:IcmT/TraK family protein [Salmonella enterica]ELT0040248.1 IcmT/TraK family protein [Salmonella enterica]ELT0107932.1 IcmT/TraK family protein [Salmonella enterica]
MSGDYHPGRDASPPVRIVGVPALAWLVFALWFKWPSVKMFLFCTGLIIFYTVLAHFGFTVTVLSQRIFHLLRGKRLTGRPWWYRKFFE